MPDFPGVFRNKVLAMTLDELTDEMTAMASNDHSAAARLMLKCVSRLARDLPLVALAAVDVAHRYWVDHCGQQEDLEKARVDCWNYLDANRASLHPDNAEFCTVRAVICTLYADAPSNDTGELLGFFNIMLFKATQSSSEQLFAMHVLSALA